MTAFYLDADVLIPLVVKEASSPLIQAFVTRHAGQLITSEFAATEAASGVSRLVRMGQLDADLASAALADLDGWRLSSTEQVETIPGDVRFAHMLVRRFETKLRAPDALHVALAWRRSSRFDRREWTAACAQLQTLSRLLKRNEPVKFSTRDCTSGCAININDDAGDFRHPAGHV